MSIYMGYVLGSVALDILANLALEKSNGFARRGWGSAAVLLIMAAFALLALAVWLVFGQRLNLTSWLGVGILILAILLIRLG
ncbi:multidrug transporter subunit MdtI [Nitratireductor sp. B36]|uniref:multidrug transporter subunit MdtI n=1 Tax=Nitratireductor sp. B36 TaxID=2762059 RepID=UPI001E3F8C10|nr:multidrug transporter subunit MdtI [Nitratireductor sp. B36]MCC5778132.1 multidrug transporter subunit MdtI [Nitratireductor sp. B36]